MPSNTHANEKGIFGEFQFHFQRAKQIKYPVSLSNGMHKSPKPPIAKLKV